jgi:hypothetical protein
MEEGQMTQVIYAGERKPLPVGLEYGMAMPDLNAWLRFLPDINDRELLQLARLVQRKFPSLVPMDDKELAGLKIAPMPFKVAFAFVNQWGRTENLLDRRFFVGHWGEECEAWAKSVYAPSRDVDRWTFCSCVAHGDVLFQLRASAWEAVIGLSQYQHSGRRPGYARAGDAYGRITMIPIEPAWRQILRGERSLPDSSPPPELDKDPTKVHNIHNMVRERWRDHI